MNPNTTSTAEVVEQDINSETAEQELEVNPNSTITAEVVAQDSETVEILENKNKTLTQNENSTPDLETSSTENVPQ